MCSQNPRKSVELNKKQSLRDQGGRGYLHYIRVILELLDVLAGKHGHANSNGKKKKTVEFGEPSFVGWQMCHWGGCQTIFL